MKQSNVSKFAYAAGIIDGEGSISISKRGNSYGVSVDVGMKDGRVIDFLYGTFGGNIRVRHHEETHFGNSYSYKDFDMISWYLKCQKAKEFLRRIYPFLRVKKRQAELAIRLQQRIEVGIKRCQIRNPGFRTGFRCNLSDHEIMIRDKIVEEIKSLNHQVRKSSALEAKRNEGSLTS